jgi:hypothetical protein
VASAARTEVAAPPVSHDTVLVRVDREANVIGDLIANLAALDHPEENLEVPTRRSCARGSRRSARPAIGPRNALGFLALIGETPVTFLLIAVAWGLGIADALRQQPEVALRDGGRGLPVRLA